MSDLSSTHLTKGRLARNTLWSLLGQVLPPLIAVLSIPFLVSGLGMERFGLLNLAWVVIGYFGMVDLGLGRATTYAIAERIGAQRDDEIPDILSSVLAVMFILGSAGALAGMGLTPWLVRGPLNIPADLQTETLHVFYLLALTLPFDMMSAGLRGAMEAKHRFDLTTIMRFVSGVFTYIAPSAMLLVSQRLDAVVAVLVLGRIAAFLLNVLFCIRVYPALRLRLLIDRDALRPLVRKGGWMNVAGVIYPLMVTLDRFMVSSVVSIAAVAYYSTPYEMVTRLWTIPTAIAGVLFPVFSASFISDRPRVIRLFTKGGRFVFLCLFPVTFCLVTFAHDGLRLWLGHEFAANSGQILQLLAIGVCVNSLSNVPYALIHGAGRPDVTAKIHLVELPIYAGSVWMAGQALGVEGIAFIWMLRGAIDTAIMFIVAQRLLQFRALPVPAPLLVLAIGLFATALALSHRNLEIKIAFLAIGLLGFAGAAWLKLLDPDDRSLVLDLGAAVRSRIWRGQLTAGPVDSR